MKIKVVEKSIDEVMALPGYAHKDPVRQSMFFRRLLRTLSAGELKKVHFSCKKDESLRAVPEDEPCLILMNHSSFIDLKIASTVLYPREFHIVCTADGFVGKEGLMRRIGCIPTFKFISDPVLIKDMVYTLRKLRASVLMYPEASYSFDGTATPLPDSLGKCIKLLNVPVLMIRTFGAFQRDPLYNNLQLRKIDVSAEMRCLLTREAIRGMSADGINAVLADAFSFDNWQWQLDSGIRVTEPFRADGLHRVLYKCPRCGSEGRMTGKGTILTCGSCGISYELTESGQMRSPDEDAPRHIPDWYRWERQCVRREIEDGTYRAELPVDIGVMVNTDAVYRVGEGVLVHSPEGFHLTGCGGRIDYRQSPQSSYSLYADYFWYEIGDMICVGTAKIQYYCFPKEKNANVAKARLAAEEMYRRGPRGTDPSGSAGTRGVCPPWSPGPSQGD